MENVISAKSGKIDAIQVLRVFGALTVSLSHVPFILAKCNIVFGVDIFLIITGFLAMYTTQRNDRMIAWKYAAKKAIRLLPLYWLITLAAFTASTVIPGVLNDEPTIEELIKSMLFIPYTRISRVTEIMVIRPIVGPAHTLMYDVYFYVVFIIAAKVNFKRRGLITALFIIAVYTLDKMLPNNNVFLNFYASPWVLDLVLGVVLFHVTQLLRGGTKYYIKRGFSLLCAGLCSAWLIYEGTQHLASIPYFIRKSLPAFVLVLTFVRGTEGMKLPKFLVRLGDVSYSYYLIHYFCLMFVSKFVVELTSYSTKGLLCALAALLIALGMSFASWYVIEKKFSNHLIKKLLK